MRGLEAGGSCGLGGCKASSQRFYPLGCLRLVQVFFRAHLAADSSFLCGIVLAGGPDNFLLLLVLTDADDESFWRSLCVAHHGAPARGV
jgi:membrane protein YqaA with SNARE-associated domain